MSTDKMSSHSQKIWKEHDFPKNHRQNVHKQIVQSKCLVTNISHFLRSHRQNPLTKCLVTKSLYPQSQKKCPSEIGNTV